jgi:hypothetical protein
MNEGTLRDCRPRQHRWRHGWEPCVCRWCTLRLGARADADDLSTRTISFLLGGGTLDTNGIDVALDEQSGLGCGRLHQGRQLGNLTLNATCDTDRSDHAHHRHDHHRGGTMPSGLAAISASVRGRPLPLVPTTSATASSPPRVPAQPSPALAPITASTGFFLQSHGRHHDRMRSWQAAVAC